MLQRKGGKKRWIWICKGQDFIRPGESLVLYSLDQGVGGEGGLTRAEQRKRVIHWFPLHMAVIQHEKSQMIWKSTLTVREELGASLMSSYNTSKEKKKTPKLFFWTLWPHFRLLLWLKLELILWHISQMPPLVLKPQVEWIFTFLSYGICRMKRRGIKGLKTPEESCLALISLLSGTERQKQCSKPEVLLALMRHNY